MTDSRPSKPMTQIHPDVLKMQRDTAYAELDRQRQELALARAEAKVNGESLANCEEHLRKACVETGEARADLRAARSELIRWYRWFNVTHPTVQYPVPLDAVRAAIHAEHADETSVALVEEGIHVASGPAGPDAKQFSARDIEAMTAIAFALRKKHAEAKTSAAVRDVLAELKRQQEVEGFDSHHDDLHDAGALAAAAGCYALHAFDRLATEQYDANGVPHSWPWEAKWWKPKDVRRDLVRAAALVLAEAGRFDRAVRDPCNHPSGWVTNGICGVCLADVTTQSPAETSIALPNDAFRWICPHCTTVNGLDDATCLGCRRPRETLAVPSPRCLCGRGKYYHPWRFCSEYKPAIETSEQRS